MTPQLFAATVALWVLAWFAWATAFEPGERPRAWPWGGALALPGLVLLVALCALALVLSLIVTATGLPWSDVKRAARRGWREGTGRP